MAAGMRALAWGLVSFIGFLLILLALVWPVSQLQEALAIPNHLALGGWMLVWVVATGAWTRVAARLTLGQWLPTSRLARVVLVTGAVVSAIQVAVMTIWTTDRFGMNEWEYVGPTAVVQMGVAAVAVAGFGVMIAPRSAVWSPLICVGLGVALTVAILIENLPGLADGLSPDSGGLAIATSVSAAYVLIVGVLSFRRVWHRGTLDA